MLRLFTFSLLTTSLAASDTLHAPNFDAQPIDQRLIAKNSCGPVSLLNAYRFSSDPWRSVIARMPSEPVRKFEYFTKYYCSRFSKNAYMRRRWNNKNGIRPDDLSEAINELHTKAKLPQLSLHSLFRTGKTPSEQTAGVHQVIAKSLKSGFPPIAHIARYGEISANGTQRWSIIASHYVVITEIPSAISKNQTEFRLQYADSADGYTKNGVLEIAKNKYFANDITNKEDNAMKQSPCLIANLPYSKIGAELVQQGSPSALIITHLIGATSAPETNSD